MDQSSVSAHLIDAIDFEPLNGRGIYFGQYMQSGFTLENGDRKFEVTVTEVTE